MSWYSVGAENAEKLVQSAPKRRRTKNFFTRPGESAVIRFLSPASQSFNYKRAFVPWAKGQKLYTSPGVSPDPFVEAGLQLQTSFAWLILDRRVLQWKDPVTGEDKETGPRILYFADGITVRKQLLSLEKEVLANVNEERQEEGKDPLSPEEHNLTSYDIKVVKEKGSPWNFFPRKEKPLSAEDKALIKEYSFDLAEELKPYPQDELKALLRNGNGNGVPSDNEDEGIAYSYDSEDDTIKFD